MKIVEAFKKLRDDIKTWVTANVKSVLNQLNEHVSNQDIHVNGDNLKTAVSDVLNSGEFDGVIGEQGKDGLTPFIGDNGNWWIGENDTGVQAQGEAGQDGADGADGKTPYIQGGYWYINGTNSGVKAQGENGQDGAAGQSGADGREIELQKSATHVQWRYVGDTVWTNLIGLSDLKGESGEDGKDGADGKDGTDGNTPYIQNGYWYINGNTTNVKAEGVDGVDGSTPYIQDGYWYINGNNTNVKAEGVDGKDGESTPLFEGTLAEYQAANAAGEIPVGTIVIITDEEGACTAVLGEAILGEAILG